MSDGGNENWFQKQADAARSAAKDIRQWSDALRKQGEHVTADMADALADQEDALAHKADQSADWIRENTAEPD